MKKVLLIICILLLVGCKKEEEPEIKPSDLQEVTVRYYYDAVTTQTNPLNPKETGVDEKKLYLLSSGEFWFESGIDCREMSYGVYSEGPTYLILNEIKTYSCNECYYDLEYSTTYEKTDEGLSYGGILLKLQDEEVDINQIRRTDDVSCASLDN